MYTLKGTYGDMYTHMYTCMHTHPHTLTPSQVIGIVLTCWYRNQKDPNANPSAFL